MAKNIGKLAGLAALAGAAYMMSKGKDKGKSDDAGDQKTSAYTKEDKKVGSDETKLKTQAESIKEADKSVGSGPSISDKGPSGTTTPGPDKSVPNLDVKPAPAPKPANVPKIGDPSQSRGVLRSDRDTVQDKPLYKQEGVTIGGTKKRTEGNEPMPSLKAVESKAAARKASISTDALRNASRKTAASNTPKSKTPAAPAATTSKTPDAPKNATNKFEHEMPITKVFKSIRAAGEKDLATRGMKRGGAVKMASGGMAASRRGDGIAQRGKTRGKMC
jgi:hypothetical protein